MKEKDFTAIRDLLTKECIKRVKSAVKYPVVNFFKNIMENERWWLTPNPSQPNFIKKRDVSNAIINTINDLDCVIFELGDAPPIDFMLLEEFRVIANRELEKLN